MTPAAILKNANSDGVILSLSASGTLKANGDQKQVDKWLPIIRENKISLIAALSEAANDLQTSSFFAWLIHFTDRDPVKVTFSPEATHAEALALYPVAVAAEPIATTTGRAMTESEAAMLQVLITAVYRNDSPDDQNEALQAALADPDNALACYTAIASERELLLGNDLAQPRNALNERNM